MKDTIYRQAAIIQLSHNKIGDDDFDVIIQRDIETIKQLPPAEPERKAGRWIKPKGVMPPEHFGRHRCSECEAFAMHDWKHHREQLTNFCPVCGADMRGEQDE